MGRGFGRPGCIHRKHQAFTCGLDPIVSHLTWGHYSTNFPLFLYHQFSSLQLIIFFIYKHATIILLLEHLSRSYNPRKFLPLFFDAQSQAVVVVRTHCNQILSLQFLEIPPQSAFSFATLQNVCLSRTTLTSLLLNSQSFSQHLTRLSIPFFKHFLPLVSRTLQSLLDLLNKLLLFMPFCLSSIFPISELQHGRAKF